MKLPIRIVLVLLTTCSLPLPTDAADAETVAPDVAPISGVFHAEPVPGSPRLTASGLAWWDGRLVIADRVPRQLLAFTPPDKFEVFKTLTHPVGVAADPDGRLVF